MLLEVYVKRNGLLQSLARRFDDIVLSCRNSLLPLAPDFVSFAAILSNTASTSTSRSAVETSPRNIPKSLASGKCISCFGLFGAFTVLFLLPTASTFRFFCLEDSDSDPWVRQLFQRSSIFYRCRGNRVFVLNCCVSDERVRCVWELRI